MKTLALLPSLLLAGISTLAHADDWDITKLDLSKLPPASTQTGVTFAKDIRPIFETSCFRCHGEQRQKGDLRLDTLEYVLKGGEVGKIVVPGDSKKSLLVAAVAQVNDDVAMPPKRGGGRGPGGPGGPGPGGPGGAKAPGGAGPGDAAKPGGAPAGGPGPGRGNPAKPLTPEQVGLVRAWIDQGAK